MTTTNNDITAAFNTARLARNEAMHQSFEADLAHAGKQAERIAEEAAAEVAKKVLTDLVSSDSPSSMKQLKKLTKEFKNLRTIAFNTSLHEASMLRFKRESNAKFEEATEKYYAASDAYQTSRGF